MVQQVVYNSCFGGFGVHNDVVRWVRDNEEQLLSQYSDDDVAELTDATLPGETYPDGSGPRDGLTNYVTDFMLSRDNKLLADIIERNTEYDGQVDGKFASLQVAEVPDSVEWNIDSTQGSERVREKSRTFS